MTQPPATEETTPKGEPVDKAKAEAKAWVATANEFAAETAKAIASGRYMVSIAYITPDNRVQFRQFTSNFPFADTGKAVNASKRFVLSQIGMSSSRSEL